MDNSAKILAAYNALSTAAAKNGIGRRKEGATSRDMMKPRNVAAVFVRGGTLEIHASRTTGRMKDRVWIYRDGVLDGEGLEPEICRAVIALADGIGA